MWRPHMKNVKCFRETAFTAFTFFDTSYSFTPNPDVWPQMFSAAAQHRAVEAKIMLAFKRFQSRLRPQRLKCRKKIWAKAAKVGGATKAAEQQCMQQQKTASVSSKSSFKNACPYFPSEQMANKSFARRVSKAVDFKEDQKPRLSLKLRVYFGHLLL